MNKLLSILLAVILIGCGDTTVIGGDKIYNSELWVEGFVQPYGSDGTDVLLVIDKSCSMSAYTSEVIAGVETLTSALPEGGWRLNMITTDRNEAYDIDNFPLVPGDGADAALDMYNSLPQGGGEAGLDATFNYIEDNPAWEFWSRSDAALLTVIGS